MSAKPPVVAFVVVVLMIGVGCFAQAWRSLGEARRLIPVASGLTQTPTVGTASVEPTTSISVSTSTGTSLLQPATVASPVRVEVPAVGLSATVVPVGLTSNGDMEIPPPTVAGWYQLGPAPGEIGPAVLVGHVDSRSGPAVFYRLTALRVGDTVVVARADGSRARFSVSAVTVIRKAVFPLDAVFGPTQVPSLRLITCTGPFDPSSHHYIDSFIAWAVAAP